MSNNPKSIYMQLANDHNTIKLFIHYHFGHAVWQRGITHFTIMLMYCTQYEHHKNLITDLSAIINYTCKFSIHFLVKIPSLFKSCKHRYIFKSNHFSNAYICNSYCIWFCRTNIIPLNLPAKHLHVTRFGHNFWGTL